MSNNSQSMYCCIKKNICISIFWWLILSMVNVPTSQLNESFCQDIYKYNTKISINAVITHIGQDFMDNSWITEIDLSNNNIESIAKDAFRKLPNMTTLLLSNNKLGNPNQLLKFGSHNKLRILIADNAINNNNYYYWNSFTSSLIIYGYYPNLEALSLHKNSISRIQDEEFALSQSSPIHQPISLRKSSKQIQSIFPKLKFLDLSYNKIIADSKFVDLLPSSLQILDLRSNSLSCLIMDRELDDLIILNLDNNKLKMIRDSYYEDFEITYNSCSYLTLSGLKNLRYLSIFGNQIEFIDSMDFGNKIALSYLNLSANGMNDPRSDLFIKMESLEVLDLSFNKLKNIPHFSNNSKNLTFLSLNYNNIKKIMSNAFAHTRLKQLWLKKNEIDEIDVKAFIHLSVLEELDLSYNKLNFLPNGWTSSLTSLKYLDLSNNIFISLNSLSLTNTIPLIQLYLNPLEYLYAIDLKTIPQTVMINFVQISNFTHNFETDLKIDINKFFIYTDYIDTSIMKIT